MKKFSISIILIGSIVFSCLSLTAAMAQEPEFFSYERFLINQSFIDRLLGGGRIQTDLKDFSYLFTDGVVDLSNGELEAAETSLTKAKDIWPEYYGTYFLLALVYEQKGDYATAARYYKSYLVRLKNLEQGNYRISGPIIYSLSVHGVERYPMAYELVKDRLRGMNIDIEKVRPSMEVPGPLLVLVAGILFFAAFLALRYKTIPYLKRRYRVKHPPEGFWVCPACGNDNPDLAKECGECRGPRDPVR